MAEQKPGVEDLLKQVGALQERARIDQQRIADLQTQAAVDREKIANLTIALDSARQIGAAIGILMATLKVSQGEAFNKLRDASNHSQRKLRSIAKDVVLTGVLGGPKG